MSRLPIRHKLTIVVALLVIPIALLGYLFVKQSMKDIAFATKEVEGVRYLETVWPRLADLAAAGTGASASAVRGESLPEVQKALDDSLGTAEPSAAFAKTLGAVGAASARSAGTVAAIEAGRALVTKIGDGSNLILDPDLDSYYVMDAAVIKLPEAIDLGAALVGLADEQRRKGNLTDDDKLAFVARIAQFESAAAGVIASLDAARKANADGSLARAVDASVAAYTKAVDGFVPEAKRMAVALRTEPATAGSVAEGLRRAHAEFHARTDALWGASAKELDRLLGLRIDGFWSTLVTMLGLAVTVALAALILAVVLVRSIIGSINALDRRIRALGDSDIGAAIEGADGADEIAQIARAVAYFRDQTIEKLADANSDERKRALIASERRAMAGIADKVRQSVGAIIAALRDLAGAIDGSVLTVARNAEATRAHLGKAIDRLNAASADVSVVVAAVTELSASIGEISSQTNQGASAGSAARERTVAARAVADRLSSSTQRVGEITSLIADIAGQTNLLALNATIEAARAGEAGRGFAVVASEVKALADQTARATDEIARQIAEIRNASGAVLSAIDDMGVSVGNVTAVTAAIAGAVEQQNAATKEISVSLQQATDGTNGAVGAMNQLPVLAGNTEVAAGDLARLSKNLMGQAETLNREIERLLVELTDRRAADRYPADTPVAVMQGSRSHQGMVLDIAVKGMQARVPGGLGTGPVTVRFPDGLVATGAVVWSREDRIGVEFETGILVEAVQRYAASGLAA